MQTNIIQSTIPSSLEVPSCKKMLKIESGKYSGRLIAVFKTSNNEVKYTFADSPYQSWSDAQTIVNDASNSPIDIVIDSNNNIVMVYCEQTTNYIVSVKLLFGDGDWEVQSKVYIFSNGSCYTPGITIDSADNYYVVWSQLNIATFDVYLKSSSDSALSWGSGPTDNGYQLNSDLTSCFPKIVASDNYLYVIFTKDFSSVSFYQRNLNGSSWSDEYTVTSGSNIDEHFDVAVLPDGFLGVAFDADGLYYREYNGVNWGTALLLETNPIKYPQVVIVDNFPVILYLIETDSDQFAMKYIHRQTGSFSTPIDLENRIGYFDSFYLFDKTSDSYADLTAAAQSNSTADLYHPSSLLLLSTVEDKIYLGSENRFKLARILLSTPGANGVVGYSYFDGSNWRSFTPFSGNYNFDQSDKILTLWEDFDSSPENWQKSYVNNDFKYWIKIEVTTPFTTSPVGSQVTSLPNLKGFNVRR